MMKKQNLIVNWFKENIQYAIGILVLIFAFFYICSHFVFDTTQEERIEKAQQIKYQSGEIPLQEFNEKIYSDIEFSGIIEDHDYDRSKDETKTFSVESYWYIIKLDNLVAFPNNFPIKIIRIFDFTDFKKAKIYYKPNEDCTSGEKMAYRVIKKKGEIYYEIKAIDKQIASDSDCSKIYYTVEYDYFWKNKNTDSILKTIPKTPIWKK